MKKIFGWLRSFRDANPHTKYFIFNWGLYGLMILASTIYVYYRVTIEIKKNKNHFEAKIQK